MNRDVALRMDAMVMGAAASLNGIASYQKNNLSAEEFELLVKPVASALADLVELSHRLHRQFPDIVPNELKP